MMYALGVDGDYTFHEFLRECSRRKVAVQPINLRAIVLRGTWAIDVTKSDGCRLEVDDIKIVINPEEGMFFRPFYPSSVDVSQKIFLRWVNLIQGLSSWILFHKVHAINSPRGGDFNPVKSLHEHLLSQLGFHVPRSITTSDARILVDFSKNYNSIIKAHCGVRANARLVGPQELMNYDPRRGPLHLQEYIIGYDVRTHVVGDFTSSTKICSSLADYRSDPKQSIYSAFDLGSIQNEKLISATRHFGLGLAGWDFKIDGNGKVWTLEMNSMPGYAGYDRTHDGKTSGAIIDYLTSEKGRVLR